MDVFWVNLIFDTITYAITLLFIQIFIGEKYRKASYLVIMIAASFGLLVNRYIDINLPQISLIKPFLSVVILAVVLNYSFKMRFVITLMYSALIHAINAVANILTMFMFHIMGVDVKPEAILNNPWLSFWGQILVIIISVSIMVMIYYGKETFGSTTTATRKIFYAIILATFGILTANTGMFFILLREYKLPSWFFSAISFLMVAFCLLIVFLVKKFQYYGAKETELEQQEFYNNTLKETLYGMRRFKHDFSNNVSVMQVMMSKKQYNELQGYMNEMLEYNDWLNVQNVMLKIENAALYGLLISKFKYAEAIGVKLNLTVQNNIDEIKNVKMLDLCEVLGILIDNSIEAISDKKKHEVFIEIENTELYKKFRIENHFDGGIEGFNKMRQGNYTSKGESHGNGLTIVKNILKNNKFVEHSMSLSRESSNIIQEIMIYNK